MRVLQRPVAHRGAIKLRSHQLTHDLILKHMLKTLGNKTMTRLDWQIMCRISGPSFHRYLKLLLTENYVQRVKWGIYQRTEKGKLFSET